MRRIAAVILAAGRSRRFPGNKLLQLLDGKAVVRHVAEAALASAADPVIVVTGNEASAVSATLSGLPVTIVNNPNYADGLSESLKCGVRMVPADCDGAMVLLGDMPFVSPALLDNLINAFDPERGREICVPVLTGRRGNPVLWGRRFFGEILGLSGDKGAKSLMDLHGDLVFEVEVQDDAIFVDIDTPDDLGPPPI